MPDQTFRKNERLLDRSDFQYVLNKGRKKKIDSCCTVFWIEKEQLTHRLGVIASKKIGNAISRNKAKRRLREIFRRNKGLIQSTKDIVVISGKGMGTIPFSTLEKKIMDVLRA